MKGDSAAHMEEIDFMKAQRQREKMLVIRDLLKNQEAALEEANFQMHRMGKQIQQLEQEVNYKNKQNEMMREDLRVCIEHLENMTNECKLLRCDLQKEQAKSLQLLRVASQYKSKHLDIENRLKQDKERLLLQGQEHKSMAVKNIASLQQVEMELAAAGKTVVLLKGENEALRNDNNKIRVEVEQAGRELVWTVQKQKRGQKQIDLLQTSLSELNKRHDQLLREFQKLKSEQTKLSQQYDQEAHSRKQVERQLEEKVAKGKKEREEKERLASRCEELVRQNDRCKCGWQDWQAFQRRRKKAGQRRLEQIDRADQILTNLLCQK